MTRMSHELSAGSALMRLISAAPREVAANPRSSATTAGRCRVIASSARSASVSANVIASPNSSRCLSISRCSGAAIRTVEGTERAVYQSLTFPDDVDVLARITVMSGRRRVLLVEDDRDTREMYSLYLSHSGLDVTEASTGRCALEL